MKKLLLLLVIAGSVFFTSCKDDETTNEPEVVADPIVGTWVSEGANVPLGLSSAPINAAKIVATFNANKTYTVVTTDKNGSPATVTGTYTNPVSTSTDASDVYGTKGATIYSIVASQSSPAVVASGIYAVSGTKMTYEVIQTTPAITGVLAPTAAGGFGSTSINGTKYAIYVQKYVKQ
ncbi:MAG: hypothetical protein WCZ90_06140 [Melioribacteraceae bacterium]